MLYEAGQSLRMHKKQIGNAYRKIAGLLSLFHCCLQVVKHVVIVEEEITTYTSRSLVEAKRYIRSRCVTELPIKARPASYGTALGMHSAV